MFSTFTGNSRRPRNVNLSGQGGNPFANTSWSPSVVSNATKTVSNAQADREKRQADRRRLRAASRIQRTWRGHRARRMLRQSRRAEFDQLYSPENAPGSGSLPRQSLPLALTLLVSFFAVQRNDDVQRLLRFSRDALAIDLSDLAPPGIPSSRVERLMHMLVEALDRVVSSGEPSPDLQVLLQLSWRIVSETPRAVLPSIETYYTALAKLCQVSSLPGALLELVTKAVSTPLALTSGDAAHFYRAFAFSFLTTPKLLIWESNIALFSRSLSPELLVAAVIDTSATASALSVSTDGRFWLLAHLIHMRRVLTDPAHEAIFLEALYTHLSTLSSEISLYLGTKSSGSLSSNSTIDESQSPPIEPYIIDQLTSLVENDGISKVLRDFTTSHISTSQQSNRTSLLAGYILTLLRCFPSYGDDIRMRLFLEDIQTPSGPVPTVKYLWQQMRQTSIFSRITNNSGDTFDILRRYLRGSSNTNNSGSEEREWRIILLFLELYIFILRLSDDEDFFSGIEPQTLLITNSTTSRIRACGLSLGDVTALTTFLKVAAFCLYTKAHQLSNSPEAIDEAAKSRMDAYLGAGPSGKQSSDDLRPRSYVTTRLDLLSLRGMLTTAMKMLYERDSRKQFLPNNHWLMDNPVDYKEFTLAVIAEEERQMQENSEDSDDDEEEDEVAGYDDTPGFYSTLAGQRLSRHARMEKLRAKQKRALKEKRQAELAPKLEVLKHMPFTLPFELRALIFSSFVGADRASRETGHRWMQPGARHHAQIRRDHLFEDAYKAFYSLGDAFKDGIQITFVDKFGAPEAGIDGGGVTKEFLTSVTREAFGDESEGGMFVATDKQLLYPSPSTVDTLRESLRVGGVQETDGEWKSHMSSLLQRYEFLGRIIGKCMYEGVLVDLAFAGFFLLKWASAGANDEKTYKGSINDLRDMDEELYNGMMRLKNYPGDISELGIDFTINDQVSQPGEPLRTVTRKLIPNGDQVYVTNDNRLLYISYVARHRLVVQPAMQTAAFLRGLRSIIRPSWLSMFNQLELQRLVGGDHSPIDVEDLRRNTVYSGLYEIGDDGLEHPTIQLFWRVMHGFTDAQRRDVVKYVSSTPRAPLLGFAQLKPKFSIRDGGTDENRLPSTSTCVNLLKLPRYTTEETLREKLLYAVTSGAGFDLS